MAQDVLSDNSILRDRYKILRRLGGKELSNLYIAQDLLKNKYWVIKELINAFTSETQRAEAIQQFQFEARLLINLEHPQLPRIEDFFEDDKKNYLVIEYIEADELDTEIKENPGLLEESKIVDWGIQICHVLNYLHSQTPDPIIFRALSPDNIMLSDDGKLMLVNFGISKIFNPKAKTLAIAKSINPHFSPIEQYSTRSTDERSDIYSLGATLYFAITRNLPVDAIDRSIGKIPLPPPKNFNSSMSRELNDIIMKCMSIKKSDRYQNVKEVKEELEKIYKKLIPGERKDLQEVKKDDEKIRTEIPEIPISSTSVRPDRSRITRKMSVKNFIFPFLLVTSIFCVLLVLTGIFVYYISLRFSDRGNYYVTGTFDKIEEADKLKLFLENKGQGSEIKINKVPYMVQEGYVINIRLNSRDRAEKTRNFLAKNEIDTQIIELSDNGFILLISQIFEDKEKAEESISFIKNTFTDETQADALKIDSYSVYVGEREIYEVNFSVKDENKIKEVEEFMISNSYKYEIELQK